MADKKNIEIHTKTTSDTKGLKDTAKEIKEVGKAAEELNKASEITTEATKTQGKAVEELKEAYNPMIDGQREWIKAQEESKKAAEETTKAVKNQERASKSSEKVVSQVRKPNVEALRQYNTTADKASQANKKLEKSGRNTGLAFLEVSRAVEDAQYGLRGVLNNIPQIITLFGGGAGLAGVVSLTAVAFTQLFERASSANSEIKGFSDTLQEASEERLDKFLEKLRDKQSFETFKQQLEESKRLAVDLTQELENQFKTITKIRDLEQKRTDAQAELDIAEIQASDLPSSEKIKREAEIRSRVSRERNEIALKNLEDEAKLNAELIELKKEEILKHQQTINTIDKTRVTESGIADIRDRQKEALGRQGKSTTRTAEILTGGDPAAISFLQDYLQTNQGSSQDLQSLLQRRQELSSDLTSNIQSGDTANVLRVLEAIAGMRSQVEAIQGQVGDDGGIPAASAIADLFAPILAAESALKNRNIAQEQEELANRQKEVMDIQGKQWEEATKEIAKLGPEVKKLGDSLVDIELRRRATSEIIHIQQRTEEIKANEAVRKQSERERIEAEKRKLEERRRKAEDSSDLYNEFGKAADDPRLRGTKAQKLLEQSQRALADGTTLGEASKILADLEKAGSETNLAVFSTLKTLVEARKNDLQKIKDLETQIKNMDK